MIRVDICPTLPASITVANTARNTETVRKMRRERRHRTRSQKQQDDGQREQRAARAGYESGRDAGKRAGQRYRCHEPVPCVEQAHRTDRTERQGDHSETDRVGRSARPDGMIETEIDDGGTGGDDRSSRNAADQHLPAKSSYVYDDVGE